MFTSTTPFDRALDALNDPIRRFLLVRLQQESPAHPAIDPYETLGIVDDQLKTDLVHVHLPKLADADYIGWDREANTIWQGEAFHEVQPVISALEAHDDELPEGWVPPAIV